MTHEMSSAARQAVHNIDVAGKPHHKHIHSVQVQAGEQMLQQALQRADLADEQLPWDDIFAVLGNDQRPADADVPRTGALLATCF